MAGGSVSLSRPIADDTGPDPGTVPSERLALLTPALLVVLIGGGLALFEGGYSETVWYPVALFVLALLVLVLVVAPPGRGSRSRPFVVAAGLFAAFTAWSYLSILWADVPADAWTGANRTLLYLLVFLLVGLRPWPVGAARIAVGLVGLGLAALAGAMLIGTAISDDPSAWFLYGRLSEPTGYANATANLWLIGVWPALYLAIASPLRWPVRGLGLAAATLLLQMALLSQSRGAAGAAVITAVIFVLLHPRHWSALAALAVPALTMLAGWDTLTSVRTSASTGELESGLADARSWILVTVLFAFALGCLASVAERETIRRVGRSAKRRRSAAAAFFALAGVVGLVFVVVLASSGDWLDARWQEFKNTGTEQVDSGSSRFTALGSARYDTYRVAFELFRDHPVAGIGAENFAVPYLQERRTAEAPRYAHSLPFSLLSSLGLVGTLLFLGFVVAAIAGFARTRLQGSSGAREVAVGALVATLAWLVHAGVDWLYEWPALAIPAIAMLAVAVRTTDRDGAVATRPVSWLGSLPVRLVAGLLVVAAAASLTMPGAAARYERSAYRVQATDQAAAIARMDRAADLDPLDADPLIAHALFARRAGRVDEARAQLRTALEREPKNWFAHFELALLEGEARRFGPAQQAVARAAELNPRQPLVRDVRRRLDAERPVDADAVERTLGGQLSARLRPLDAP